MESSYQHVPQDPDESYDRSADYPDEESLSSGGSNGYNYREYRRPADSFKGKIEHRYWKGKQTVIEKFGKQQDEYVVAGDAEVDARLEAFRQIQKTCIDLLKAVEIYQKKIFTLSQEENESGRFLREQGSVDKTKAGKMMISVGKALSYTAQQRLTLRVPLVRLFQEVETFHHRAIGDTWQTVNRMERLRTQYRAALLWMADISKELDPEAYKKLDKYREVQSEVKVTKKKFDKCKVDVIQKVDLLSASRCNLLSATLVAYQQSLLKFWENTSSSLTKVYEQFRGHPSYQFQMLKHIIPDDSYTRENEIDDDDESAIKEEKVSEETRVDEKSDAKSERVAEEGTEAREAGDEEEDDDDDTLISLDALAEGTPVSADDGKTDLLGDTPPKMENKPLNNLTPSSSAVVQGIDDLLGLSSDASSDVQMPVNMADFMLNEMGTAPTGMNAPMSGILNNGTEAVGPATGAHLMTETNEILSTDDLLFGTPLQLNPSNTAGESGYDGSSFSETWNKMFGNEDQTTGQTTAINDNAESPTNFLPSDLIDSFASLDPYAAPGATHTLQSQAADPPTGAMSLGAQPPASLGGQLSAKQNANKPSDGNFSSWLNLFSDLDPLSNPDAIGQENQENDAKRSC